MRQESGVSDRLGTHRENSKLPFPYARERRLNILYLRPYQVTPRDCHKCERDDHIYTTLIDNFDFLIDKACLASFCNI